MKINPNQAGFALGAFLGGMHVIWSFFVFVGFAQPLMDFIFKLHMLKPVLVVQPFVMADAALLVAVTAAIGFFYGFVLSSIWNRVV